jgi:tripartite-type tricarboxylate transporter receptor subunit TctC
MFRRVVTAAIIALWISPAYAQGWPDRTVKLIVPFPAGGPLDSTARLMADQLAENLKHPFIIENRPGVAGNVGTDAVAKAVEAGQITE